MTLHLVPPGRGRWRALVLEIPKLRADELEDLPLPLLMRTGQHITIAGKAFRVSKVTA